MRTYLTTSPWIYINYRKTDDQADKDGFAEVDFECFVCSEKKYVEFKLPSLEDLKKYGEDGHPKFRKIRDDFEKAHQHPEKITKSNFIKEK